MNSHFNDDKYTALTIASLVFCYIMIGFFWRKRVERAPTEVRDEDEDFEEDEDDDEIEAEPTTARVR